MSADRTKIIGVSIATAGRVRIEDASRNFAKLLGKGAAPKRFWTSLVSESAMQAARACSMNAQSQKKHPKSQFVKENRQAVSARADKDAAGGMNPKKRRCFFSPACKERAAQKTTVSQITTAAIIIRIMKMQSSMPLF